MKKSAWFGCFILTMFLIVSIGIPCSFGGVPKGGAELPKLLPSYKSVDELYAAIAKLPADQRQEVILAGALKEGKVVTYESADEENITPVFKGFEKKYPGVKLEYFRGDADATVLKALNEIRADRWLFDYVSIGPGYGEFKKANALAKLYRLLPPGNFPKFAVGEDWFGTELLPMVMAYNTTMVKASDAPKSYKDLLDPKWRGKVSIDTSPDNIITAMLKKWGREKTEDWIDKFVNVNKALLRKGHTAQTKLLIAGEFPVASELYVYRTEHLRESEKAPIEWLIPEDLAEGEIPLLGISRRAPHPYAALLWMQYRLSKEGQQIYAQFGRLPINADAEVKYPRLKQFFTHMDRLTVINSEEDAGRFEEALGLIKKHFSPRLRGG